MKPVLLYCRSGNAPKVLRDQGFTLAKHMDGGVNAWQAAELPVTN